MVENNNGKKIRGKPCVILLTEYRTAKNPEKVSKELWGLTYILQGTKYFVGPK